MRVFLIGFAYLLIYTTPIQIGLILWASWAILTTDYTFTSFTGHVFWHEYLSLFLFLYDWLFTWFWNDLLYFIFDLPAIIPISFKLIVNTILGFWLLPIARNLPT